MSQPVDRADGSPLLLDLVSPLPPVRSGIADYSVDLAGELDGHVDLRLAQVPDQSVAPELRSRFDVIEARVARSDWPAAGGSRWPLYQVGNNTYHEAICELALASPGFVTLHDVFLHHLLLERTLAHGDLPAYVDAMVADHGWIGGASALPPRWGAYGDAVLFQLPAHRALLERQRGVLVHSDWARRFLDAEGVEAEVAVVPMPIPLPADEVDSAGAAALRQRLAIAHDRLLLGSFGFQTPIKRTRSVILALREPELHDVHLVVVGEPAPSVDLHGLARELGVADRVHVLGFVSSDTYREAMAAVDLCVNLRYPTAGETSASLLRCFASCRGAVVSDYAQFADLPGDCVVKVPVGDESREAKSVAAALAPFVVQRDRAQQLGRAARRHVEIEHDPRRAVRTLIDALERWRGAGEPPATSMRSTVDLGRPTSLTWGDLPSALVVSGVDDWRPGERRILEVELVNTGFATWLPAAAGPGGVALQTSVMVDSADLEQSRPWLPLARPIEPGGSFVFRVELRRPIGPCRLRFEPHVVGSSGFGSLGGAVWEREL